MAFNYEIPTQNFEKIRDAIGVILAAEFAGQYMITSNVLFNSQIWLERFIPFDISEMPAILIMLDSIDENQDNPGRGFYTANFQIQVYTSAFENDSQRGDVQSSFDNHKLIGAIRYIFSNPTYVRLGLNTRPLIVLGSSISDIQFIKPNNDDGNNSVVSQLTLQVRFDENNGVATTVDFEQVTSQVKLDETEKGFLLTLTT